MPENRKSQGEHEADERAEAPPSARKKGASSPAREIDEQGNRPPPSRESLLEKDPPAREPGDEG